MLERDRWPPPTVEPGPSWRGLFVNGYNGTVEGGWAPLVSVFRLGDSEQWLASVEIWQPYELDEQERQLALDNGFTAIPDGAWRLGAIRCPVGAATGSNLNEVLDLAWSLAWDFWVDGPGRPHAEKVSHLATDPGRPTLHAGPMPEPPPWPTQQPSTSAVQDDTADGEA